MKTGKRGSASSGGAGAKRKRKTGGKVAAKKATRRGKAKGSGARTGKKTGRPRRETTAQKAVRSGAARPLELTAGDACAVLVVVAERAGTERDQTGRQCDVRLGQGGGGAEASRGKRRGVSVRQATRGLSETCRMLAAAGHAQRGKLLGKLLEGPATYGALKTATGLKAGPLYHHINQLRLAGLILPKQRDLYELTRGGRNLILIAMAAGPLFCDGRRRPVGTESGG